MTDAVSMSILEIHLLSRIFTEYQDTGSASLRRNGCGIRSFTNPRRAEDITGSFITIRGFHFVHPVSVPAKFVIRSLLVVCFEVYALKYVHCSSVLHWDIVCAQFSRRKLNHISRSQLAG